MYSNVHLTGHPAELSIDAAYSSVTLLCCTKYLKSSSTGTCCPWSPYLCMRMSPRPLARPRNPEIRTHSACSDQGIRTTYQPCPFFSGFKSKGYVDLNLTIAAEHDRMENTTFTILVRKQLISDLSLEQKYFGTHWHQVIVSCLFM
jgi:hypothetical protein